MLKIERKLTDWIDKYLVQIVMVMLVVFAVYMRKATLYHRPFDMENAFYPDATGYLHTAFYTQWIAWLSRLPVVCVTTLKILTAGFDVVLALLTAFWIWKPQGIAEKRNVGQAFVCFGLLLVSPLCIANGVVWLHIDSICLSILVCAWMCLERERYPVAGLLMGLAIALQMQYVVILIGLSIRVFRKKREALPCLLVAMGVLLGLNILSVPLLNISFTEGLFSLVNWLMLDPGTGELHVNLLTWFCSLLGQFSYLLGVGSMIVAFRTRKYWKTALIINAVTILFLGGILQYGYWWSN